MICHDPSAQIHISLTLLFPSFFILKKKKKKRKKGKTQTILQVFMYSFEAPYICTSDEYQEHLC